MVNVINESGREIMTSSEIATAKKKRLNELIRSLSKLENLRPRTPADLKVLQDMVDREFDN